MTKSLVILVTIFLLVLSFSSCRKDTKTEAPLQNNDLIVEGTEFVLSQGYLEYCGGDGSGYKFNLYLMSSGITINGVKSVLDSVSGSGHVVNIEINSSRSDKLPSGNYIFNNTGLAGSYKVAGYVLNWNATQQIVFNLITSSAINVVNNGSEYELIFSGTSQNNSPVSIYYKGNLKYINNYICK
jgi:hypothetical protein